MSKKEIVNILSKSYPDILLKSGNHHLSFIKSVISYFERLDEAKEPILWPTYTEKLYVETLREIANRIKYELMPDGKHNYLWKEDKPKDDYERGIINVTRYIDAIIHWTLD